MERKQLEEYFKKAKEYEKRGTVSQIIDNYYGLAEMVIKRDNQVDLGLEIGIAGREYILKQLKSQGYTFKSAEEYVQEKKIKNGFIDAYYDFLRLVAPYDLDSYMLYVEKERMRRDRFYEPRRKTLQKVCKGLQRLEDDKLDELFIHMPARTGKSQMITMYSTWHCARDTEKSNLYVTYKEGLGSAFLDGFVEIMTDPTYLFKDVFPDVIITDSDAKNNKLDLGTSKKRTKKYKSISGKGLESGLNGEYDAYGVLICDDVLAGVEDVLSDEVLKRKKTIFDNNVMSRPKENCKKIYNGTIWATNDIFMDRLEFLETSPDAVGTRWDVIKIPALDPETDETNFDYDYGVGYSTKYWRMRRSKFEMNNDLAGWFSQCQQEPIDRTNALFRPEDMNYYSVLPSDEPVKVISHIDVALGGADYLAMPVAYYYEDEDGSLVGYVEDVVFDNAEKHVTEPEVISKVKKHQIKNLHVEANAGGEGYADDIRRLLKEDGYKQICNITTGFAPVTKRKQQRIWDNAEAIRKLYFKDPQHRDKQYNAFMNNLFGFSLNMRKRAHDDAPDSLSGLVDFERDGSGITMATVTGSWI